MNERERIELLMKCYNLTSSQFADRTGIQRASVSHIISGRNKPSLEVMTKIYNAFPDVDLKWLLMGEGEAPATLLEGTQKPEKSLSNNLFDEAEMAVPGVAESERPASPVLDEEYRVARQPRMKSQPSSSVQVERTQRKATQARNNVVLQPAEQQKKVKEVRIYFTDGTYEVLVPER